MARRTYRDDGSWVDYAPEGEVVNRSGNWGTAGYDPDGRPVNIGGQDYYRVGSPWGTGEHFAGQTFQGKPYSDFTMEDPTYGILARGDALKDAGRLNPSHWTDFGPALFAGGMFAGPIAASLGTLGGVGASFGLPHGAATELAAGIGGGGFGGAGGLLGEGAGGEMFGGGSGSEFDFLPEGWDPATNTGFYDPGLGAPPVGGGGGFPNVPPGAGYAANALGNVGDPTIDANAPTVDAGLGGGGGGSAIPPGLLGSIAQTLGMSTGDLAKLIGAGAGAATSYFTGQQNKDIAREMIDLGAPERARFRSMTPGGFATEMNPVLEQLANARARQWSQQVGNPANSPQAMIATDQDMASTLFNAYNQERGMLANTGWGLASPMTGYRSLSEAGTKQAEGIGGALGSVLDTIAGTPRRDPSADLVDLIRNNPGLFGGGR